MNKVYCYFDVVMSEGETKANATITFSDTVQRSIYITEDCMHER